MKERSADRTKRVLALIDETLLAFGVRVHEHTERELALARERRREAHPDTG